MNELSSQQQEQIMDRHDLARQVFEDPRNLHMDMKNKINALKQVKAEGEELADMFDGNEIDD